MEWCVCGHLRGDHKQVRTPVTRPVVIGYCRTAGCDCERFVAPARDDDEEREAA